MSENGLEALKRASKSALDHVELVELARTQSPSQAWKMARSAGWPNRQADACRSLAMVRRDYGVEVFVAFTATMERARTEQSVAEQVQDNRRDPMNQRILTTLQRVTDPVAKLRLTVKHDLKDHAKSIFTGLVSDYRSFFWSDRDEDDILFDTLGNVKRPGMVSYDNPKQVAQKRQHQDRILLGFADPNDGVVKLITDFEGARSFFAFTDEETTGIVRDVLTSICSVEPGPNSWRFFRPTKTIRRTYLTDDDPTAIQTELWLLQSQFRDGRLFELRENALPTPIEDHPEDEAHELDPIVDRFIELGWTMDQVRAEFLTFIKGHMENCRPQFMLAATGAKCFGYRDPERDAMMREQYRPKLWADLKTSSGNFLISMFSKFARHGFRDYDRQKEDEAWYRAEFIDLLAHGQLARVYQLLLILGHEIGVIYAETESHRVESARKYIQKLLPEAFWKAYSSARFGVAAAFAQQFGADACYREDPIRDCVINIFEPQRDSIDEQYSDIVEKWDGGEEDDEFFETGRGKEWRDAKAEIDRQQEETLVRLIVEGKEQIKGAAQLALDLGQPIRFGEFSHVLTYYVAPSWPKY